ncbi:MAG: LysR family transcriptional regulator [Acholeplasmataceae bacterium]|nr:LysR family transcriptional regulator [Acholeplasmataceae bacterium]
MTLENLYYFISIIEHKSISKAAKSEHISQSALTQVVNRLESEFHCELLSRNNKGVLPTPSGSLVYEYAKDMVSLNDSLKSRLICLNEGCSIIYLKPCCSMDNQFIPTLMYQLQSEYPNMKLTIQFDKKDKTMSEIQLGITDFGIVMGSTQKIDDIDIDIIGFEEIVLVANSSLKVNQLSVNDLSKYKIIDFSLTSYMNDIHQKIEALTSPKISQGYVPFMSIDSISSIKSLIKNNFGISFLPKYTVTVELDSELFKVIQINDFTYKLPVKIISKRDDLLPELNRNIKKSLIKTSKKYLLDSMR